MNSRVSEKFFGFYTVQSASKSFRTCKIYILKEKFVTIDLNFLTLESAYEASKTNLLNVIFIRKSRASEDFLDFGQLKVPFKF